MYIFASKVINQTRTGTSRKMGLDSRRKGTANMNLLVQNISQHNYNIPNAGRRGDVNVSNSLCKYFISS